MAAGGGGGGGGGRTGGGAEARCRGRAGLNGPLGGSGRPQYLLLYLAGPSPLG